MMLQSRGFILQELQESCDRNGLQSGASLHLTPPSAGVISRFFYKREQRAVRAVFARMFRIFVLLVHFRYARALERGLQALQQHVDRPQIFLFFFFFFFFFFFLKAPTPASAAHA